MSIFKNKQIEETPAPSPVSTSLIGAGTTITGDIQSDGDIRIDGVLKGNIRSAGKVIVGSNGIVEGDVDANNADVLGKINGKLVIKALLNIRDKALINGDIFTGQLQFEPSATFNGSCHMGANVVDLKSSNTSNPLNAANNQ
jgi:cytoskeletal protein CcmA (bactofilin family)